MSSIVSGLTHLSGWVAYSVIAALVFGETAVFLGFVLPGETAVVLGGVLASRGHLSLAVLVLVVVSTALVGPMVGYEIGRRMGDRLFATRALRRVPGGPERARAALRDRGGLAVLLGRFVAFVRALMPAAAGAVRVPYRTFLVYNVAGGIIWGVGYCLLGYLAGSAYSAIETRIGAGLAVAVAAIVVAVAAVWAVRRHRAAPGPGVGGPAALPGVEAVLPEEAALLDEPLPGEARPGEARPGEAGPGEAGPGEPLLRDDSGRRDDSGSGGDPASRNGAGAPDDDRPREPGDLPAEQHGD